MGNESLRVRRKIGSERGKDRRQDAANTVALEHRFFLKCSCPLSYVVRCAALCQPGSGLDAADLDPCIVAPWGMLAGCVIQHFTFSGFVATQLAKRLAI